MKLSQEDVDQRMKSLSGWTLQGDAIRKQFHLQGFSRRRLPSSTASRQRRRRRIITPTSRSATSASC